MKEARQKRVYYYTLFKWNYRKEKANLWWQKTDQSWLRPGLREWLTIKGQQRTFCDERNVLFLDYNGGYKDI